jgi:hypothetical protein
MNSIFVLFSKNKDLRIILYFSFVCLFLSVVGLFFDERILQYVPIWLKPFKFSISSIIFVGSILIFLKYIPDSKILRISSKIISYGLMIELIIIFFQAYRGRMSHFNNQTWEDMILFQIMAVVIVLVWIGFGMFTYKLMKLNLKSNDLLLTGIQLGAVITFLSMPFAFAMPSPNKEQIELIKKNKSQVGLIIGSHTIQEKDPSKVYPITGWAKTGGDLRIAHFMGLHALQILPLLAMFFRMLPLAFFKSKRILLVIGIFYFSIVVFTLIQALMGIPLLGRS